MWEGLLALGNCFDEGKAEMVVGNAVGGLGAREDFVLYVKQEQTDTVGGDWDRGMMLPAAFGTGAERWENQLLFLCFRFSAFCAAS